MTRPFDYRRHPEGAFPVGVFLAAERRAGGIGPGKEIRPVVGGEHHDGVVGDLRVVELFEQLATSWSISHMPSAYSLPRPIPLSAVRLADVGEDMHAREVHPHEEGLLRLDLAINEIHAGGRGFIVNGFHPLFDIERASVRDLAIGKTVNHPRGL